MKLCISVIRTFSSYLRKAENGSLYLRKIKYEKTEKYRVKYENTDLKNTEKITVLRFYGCFMILE